MSCGGRGQHPRESALLDVYGRAQQPNLGPSRRGYGARTQSSNAVLRSVVAPSIAGPGDDGLLFHVKHTVRPGAQSAGAHVPFDRQGHSWTSRPIEHGGPWGSRPSRLGRSTERVLSLDNESLEFAVDVLVHMGTTALTPKRASRRSGAESTARVGRTTRGRQTDADPAVRAATQSNPSPDTRRGSRPRSPSVSRETPGPPGRAEASAGSPTSPRPRSSDWKQAVASPR